MSTQTLDLIIKSITGALSVILAILSIITGVKSGKWKKLFSKEQVKRGCIYVLMSIMQDVEKFRAFSSEEKKQYVKTKFNQYCIENGYDYDDDLTDENIEELIDFSKKVNGKDDGTGQEHKL